MKYCATCGAEYTESAKECSDCGGKEFLTAEQYRATGRPLPGEVDTRVFVSAGSAEDPLSAEQFTRALEAAGIAVYARARRAGTVDTLTSGTTLPWWEILVPEDQRDRAIGIIKEETARIDANAAEAAKAAEEEEEAGERQS